MAAKDNLERDAAAAKPDQGTRDAIEKTKAEAKAPTQARAGERTRLKAQKALAEAEEALATAQAQVEQERQARVKAEQARAEAERALAQARKAASVESESTELPSTTAEAEGAEQRVSFVVRVTVDERGKPLRTEVEHPQSGKKETYPALDVQRLAAFIKACISPPSIAEPIISPAPPPAEAVRPESPKPAFLTISDVQVFRMGVPGVMTLMLSPNETFVVQARFQLQGPEAPSLTAQESSFEMKVYANEVTGSTSRLLTTHRANTVKGVIAYTAQTQVPGLSPGLYRLFTLVTFRAPINLAGYHEGPIVHVAGVQPLVNPTAPLEVPLPQ